MEFRHQTNGYMHWNPSQVCCDTSKWLYCSCRETDWCTGNCSREKQWELTHCFALEMGGFIFITKMFATVCLSQVKGYHCTQHICCQLMDLLSDQRETSGNAFICFMVKNDEQPFFTEANERVRNSKMWKTTVRWKSRSNSIFISNK